jgi:hypothetical protein
MNKKAMEGVTLLVAIVAGVAVMLILIYFAVRGGRLATDAAGCGEYECKRTTAECKQISNDLLLSPKSCTIPGSDGVKGWCCMKNPIK